MRDLLKISKLQRMLYLRLFLCMNNYPNISEETFNEMAPVEGLAASQNTTSQYPVQYASRNSGQHTHTSIFRESQEINSLIQLP